MILSFDLMESIKICNSERIVIYCYKWMSWFSEDWFLHLLVKEYPDFKLLRKETARKETLMSERRVFSRNKSVTIIKKEKKIIFNYDMSLELLRTKNEFYDCTIIEIDDNKDIL